MCKQRLSHLAVHSASVQIKMGEFVAAAALAQRGEDPRGTIALESVGVGRLRAQFCTRVLVQHW